MFPHPAFACKGKPAARLNGTRGTHPQNAGRELLLYRDKGVFILSDISLPARGAQPVQTDFSVNFPKRKRGLPIESARSPKPRRHI